MKLEYEVIGRVGLLQETKIYEIIGRSKKYEIADESKIGRLNHIVIKGTEIPVGSIGSETFDKVNPKDKSLEPHHKFLEAIYRIITNLSISKD